jgi:hypothetical protein
LRLNRDCYVYLENAGLSQAILRRIQAACEAEGYAGPRIHFSIDDRANTLGHATLQDAFASICAKASIADTPTFEQRYPALSSSMKEGNNEENLRSWLSRLSEMKDAQREEENGLYKIILSHLDLAEANEEFRNSFFAIIYEAAQTCGDRMALSVLHLGIANQRQSIDRSDLRAYGKFLLRGPWMIKQLEQIAREKVKTLRVVDEIEVYLAYPVKLKDRLDLPIDVKDMLYFRFSGVTEQDLNNAATSLKEILKEPGAEENILTAREEWIDALMQHPDYASEIAAINQIRAAGLEDGQDWSTLQMEYESAIVAITKQILED